MTTSVIRRTVVLTLVAAQGCMYVPPSKGGRGIELTTGRARVNRNDGNGGVGGFAPKVVENKRKPTRLVARDGTSCVVSTKKFNSTEPGESVWCTWFDTDR